MTLNFFIAILFTYGLGLYLFPRAMRFALKHNLVDIPSSRKKHSKPVPIIGGVVVIFVWIAGLAVFLSLHPHLIKYQMQSFLALSASICLLLAIGLYDDIKGAGPYLKLFVQLLATAITLGFEPNIRAACMNHAAQIQNVLGLDMSFWIWPLAAFWILSATNAINLIDGLDGLAGGTSLLIATSVAIIFFFTGTYGNFGFYLTAFLVPALVAFLHFNWSPAKIFLGDNGSLPLGFALGLLSLFCNTGRNTYVIAIGALFMFAYPLLDMTLCVIRRYHNKNRIFKADRNHLHYRIQRLGLNTSKTAIALLTMSAYFQVIALTTHFFDMQYVFTGTFIAVLSCFSFLFLIFSIEGWQVARVRKKMHVEDRFNLLGAQSFHILQIDLKSLYEVGLLEEKQTLDKILICLQVLLERNLRKEDHLLYTNDKIKIMIPSDEINQTPEEVQNTRNAIIEKFRNLLQGFQENFRVHASLSEIPIQYRRRDLNFLGNLVADTDDDSGEARPEVA